MNIQELCDPLEDLFNVTHTDWYLSVSMSLTEPTCPRATIYPEGWSLSRYSVNADSFEESLEKVVALVKREVIDKQIVGSAAPYTESDDSAFEKWLHERAAGSDAELPAAPSERWSKP
jgi:hypothetical protein